ncbi:hypothetical protein G3N56_08130 [Desulfovibrio sulfodismutans]|uniref:Uncharacterized protein n=1 Tax=Desulfolutivibrio sulfodismutans TaxID=63561 RepID=A0A7K3NKK4_9BACT|nr:hypothetical protein [Desulfolutivibrio sulfodismutans]NDY56710.1 hypothetical protein [Desulfolutivibrio sulfodismutans]QLA13487.1 hypothetical protein GD606_15055 [Desulfolutivibrio sulfodismutans DSM 3696]
MDIISPAWDLIVQLLIISFIVFVLLNVLRYLYLTGTCNTKNNSTKELTDSAVKERIKKEIYSQLESTYDDAPIDGKRWNPRWFGLGAIIRIFSLFGLTRSDFKHDDITIKVYRRLLLRHSILNHVEKLSRSHDVNYFLDMYFPAGILQKKGLQSYLSERIANDASSYKTDCGKHFPLWDNDQNSLRLISGNNTDIINGKMSQKKDDSGDESQPFSLLPPPLRAYNLAVTDLFVEKALSYLNRKARTYNIYGFFLSCVAFVAIAIGTFVALANTVDNDTGGKFAEFVNTNFKKTKQPQAYAEIPDHLSKYIDKIENINDSQYVSSVAVGEYIKFISSDQANSRWIRLISAFVRGFTFYGLLVLLAVFCYRMAKALFDQAERLKDRRHALRQGRLFVHLNGGKMSIDEMEKAFNWNMSSENAFANINPDAQAPWGNVVKEMLKTIRETSKAGIKAAERK